MASASAVECTATWDAELLAGAQHAQRDLAAVGDEDLVEHGRAAHSMIISGSPYSTGWPSSTGSRHRAGARRRDLVHRLHRLDDQQRLAGRHLAADLDERLARRARGADRRCRPWATAIPSIASA
jgi:hypothetical protein